MTWDYFAFGTTLANMTNVETVIAEPPNEFIAGRIPLLRPVAQRELDSSVVRNGKINSVLTIEALTHAERVALNTFLFGSQSLAYKRLYMSARDEFGFFSPFYVSVQRPYEGQDYKLPESGVYVRDVTIPLWDCQWQITTINSSGSVTTSQHYVQSNTSGGSVTLDLPALAGVVENVVYSFEKMASANSLVLNPDGSETIDGASTKTLTANGSRVDIVKSGSAWVTVKSGSMV